MHNITDHASTGNGRALIIGAENQKVDQLKCHLAEYFSEIGLLTDPGELNSLTADSPSIIVVTDTLEGVLSQYFFYNLRSLHPRARLLCLVDHISRESERALRAAGLLFLGSYDHFGVYHTSILKSAVAKVDPIANPSSTVSVLTRRRLNISLITESREKDHPVWDSNTARCLSRARAGCKISEAPKDGAEHRSGQHLNRVTDHRPANKLLKKRLKPNKLRGKLSSCSVFDRRRGFSS